MAVMAVFDVSIRPDQTDEAAARYARYRSVVGPMIEAAGGRYLVRAGDPEWLEGDDGLVRRTHLIEFPNAQTARDLWQSAEYRELRELRVGAVDVRAFLVEVAGADR